LDLFANLVGCRPSLAKREAFCGCLAVVVRKLKFPNNSIVNYIKRFASSHNKQDAYNELVRSPRLVAAQAVFKRKLNSVCEN
jgi:hypothetical protein